MMFARRSLTVKLILAFALVSMLGVGLAAVLAHMVTVREFERFFKDKNRSEFVASAVAYYQTHGTWSGVEGFVRGRAPLAGTNLRTPPPTFALVDERGIVVSPAAPYQLGERVPAEAFAAGQALHMDGRRIGTVIDAGRRRTLSDREAQYLASTDRALGLAALGAIVLAVLLGTVLAGGLTRPLRDLTRAIRDMTGGELRQQVPVRSADELGDLTRAFNQLSSELARSNDARRQMTADIAHDLRTPLTVMAGYIEGLRDGVLQPTPARFEAMHFAAEQLKHLVEDLRTLSLADAGELPLQRRAVSPAALMERVVSAHKHHAAQRGVELAMHADAGIADIDVDAERLVQVLGNLVDNALRHTPRHGRVDLMLAARNGLVQYLVRDDGEGIRTEDLPHVFDRFYRADGSRQAGGGESGLGLAIARSIVEAHGGTISVESRLGHGTTFTVTLSAAGSPPQVL